ncbi:MAG: hypothetical protein L6R42_007502 [Xanthoria sp. 1 TBL-2021]|nr:MAG: hypothetical protein L6R42_007502 [Xanthoria sp. 1 TBL-2021]
MAQQPSTTLPSGSSNRLKNIAIVGATGTSGKFIVQSLLATGKHKVTALTREGGTAQMPSGITVQKVNYSDPSTLVSALRGQDALIITMGVRAPPDQQTKLIHAAAEAGVQWILPNEFGYDSANEALADDILPNANKKAYTELVEKLGVSKWVGFVCGFWYEFSLGGSPDRFGFDFQKKEVVLFDEGTQPISVTTFPMVGKGVASLLSLPISREDSNGESACLEDFGNRFCYVASFVVSQKDMLDSVLRVTKTDIKDWTITKESSKERYEKGMARLRGGDYAGMVVGMYSRNFFPDGSGNHSVTKGLDNEKLGLPKEDLDEFTEVAVKQALDGVSDAYHSSVQRG